MMNMLFPFLFPRYEAPEDKLCTVIDICSGRYGAEDPAVDASAFVITLEDHRGARGKINVGSINSSSPWLKLEIGDKVLAKIKRKELFRFEMKILKLNEIYYAKEDRIVILAA